MNHALGLAARGLGRVWPNPAVGCVIVQGGRVVGRGVTQPGGRPHAERVALAQAGPAARGATAYVTLEPCAHHGQTGPCAEALIAAGIGRVVTAMTDPDPRVSGRGHALLRAADIPVTEGICGAEAAQMNAGFVKRIVQGLPFVTLKMASSLDGRTALADGSSRWITGPAARRMVHALRLSHDAVMVGVGTVLADDPDLRARDIGAGHQPLRIVLDAGLRTPSGSRLVQTAQENPVWIVHDAGEAPAAAQALTKAGVLLVPVTAGLPGPQRAVAALRALADKGVTRILSEGGATLAASLLAADLVDALATFTAGLAIGAEGHPMLGRLPAVPLDQVRRYGPPVLQRFGPDTLTVWPR
jgi:diaminohydroxyphosphoribosylaminopyrimidine deaminase / 5-amino-6-(5-phosphoribosylamino)uracil reductase